jgi:hypothetical protein
LCFFSIFVFLVRIKFFFILKGKLVWFDPGCGYHVPGEIVEENRLHKSIIVQSSFTGKVFKLQFVVKNGL